MDKPRKPVLHERACQVPLLGPAWLSRLGSGSRLGTAAIRSLSLRVAPVCPFDLRSWRSILSRWTRPHAQQDCAELLAHLAERFDSSLLLGRWDARVLEEGSVRLIPVFATAL